jgi:hypothetical protein
VLPLRGLVQADSHAIGYYEEQRIMCTTTALSILMLLRTTVLLNYVYTHGPAPPVYGGTTLPNLAEYTLGWLRPIGNTLATVRVIMVERGGLFVCYVLLGTLLVQAGAVPFYPPHQSSAGSVQNRYLTKVNKRENSLKR